ncbi:MAG: phosphoglycerate kinase [bacterium]|nr:phosphoglycerate kinase [bacterium]
MDKIDIRDLDLDGRKLLLRVDFNVPLRDGGVADDKRIVAALPTLRHALERGAAVILMSHLGRPKGQVKPEFSLRPVRERLEQLLERPVGFAEDCVGAPAESAAADLRPGDVLLLENLRFHPGEQKPETEPDFAERLARLGDAYVNDAFGTAHRAHASMVAVAERFERRASGLLLARELDYFGRALSAPERPFLAILGGAKVGDKIPVMGHLLDKVDRLLVGGAMAYTFLKALGNDVGASRVEQDRLETAREILERAASRNVEILLPSDHVCGAEFDEGTERRVVEQTAIPEGWMGLDIGPGTVARFSEAIGEAGTIVWNGPMGVFEWAPFSEGTLAVARACAASGATTIVGGGDSVSAANKSGVADKFSHISTGGGASLELLEGKLLPGVAVLTDR